MIYKISENFSSKKSLPVKQALLFRNLLFSVSIISVLLTALLQLDLVPAVLLGCAVIGFNYFLTTKLVRKLLLERKLIALDILFLFSKFGISVLILYGALRYLELTPIGLLIGISNVAVAAIIFTFFRMISLK